MIKERTDKILSEIGSRVATEFDSADGAAIEARLMVEPRSKHQEYFLVGILWLNRGKDMDGAIDVFLVPKAMHKHHWN